MKKLALALIISSIFAVNFCSYAEILLDTIIATVDDKPITLLEFGKRLHPPRKLTVSEIKNDATLLKSLDGYILEKLLIAEAERKSIKVQEDDVTKYINEVQAKNNLDSSGFEEALKKEGTSLTEYKERIRTEILKSRVASASVKSSTALTEEEIDEFIKERLTANKKIQTGKRIHLKNVKLSFNEYSEQEALKMIELIKSDDSDAVELEDLGFVFEKDLSTEILSALQGKQEEQFSEIIKTDSYIQIFQIIEYDNGPKEDSLEQTQDPVKNVPEDVRAQLRAQLEQIKLQKRMEQFVEQELPKLHTVDKRI